jgi:hypothetical protein
MDELLGFIDYLVQELKSKIILIYNEERLYQKDRDKIPVSFPGQIQGFDMVTHHGSLPRTDGKSRSNAANP